MVETPRLTTAPLGATAASEEVARRYQSLRGVGPTGSQGGPGRIGHRSLPVAGLPAVGVPADGWPSTSFGRSLARAGGTAPRFPRRFCSVAPSGAAAPRGGLAFEPRCAAGDRQPRSIRWVSRPPERWRILGARRAGRDWFSPSGAASGSSATGASPLRWTGGRGRGPTSVLPPRRFRWVAAW
jgi:hypothetical protein